MIRIIALFGLATAMAFAGRGVASMDAAASAVCPCGVSCECTECGCGDSCPGGDDCCCASGGCCDTNGGCCGDDAACDTGSCCGEKGCDSECPASKDVA